MLKSVTALRALVCAGILFLMANWSANAQSIWVTNNSACTVEFTGYAVQVNCATRCTTAVYRIAPGQGVTVPMCGLPADATIYPPSWQAAQIKPLPSSTSTWAVNPFSPFGPCGLLNFVSLCGASLIPIHAVWNSPYFINIY